MNRKTFLILIVLLVVLGGAGLLVRNSKIKDANSGEQGSGQKVLGDKFDVNAVAHISLKQGSNEVNLVRKDDLWRVKERNNYPANFEGIRDFLMKSRDLKIVQKEEIGASQLPRLELSTGPGASGVLVDFKDKDDKSLKIITLGKKHMRKPQAETQAQFGDEGFPDGRYVMVSTDTKNALLVAEPFGNVEPKPDQWLNKTFFKIEKPKTIAVEFPNGTNSWKISKDTEAGEWKLTDLKAGEQLDSAKVGGVSSPFASASFNDVKVDAKPEELGLDKPTTITVNTFDDFTYVVKVGKKSGDDYPVTLSVSANIPEERTPAKDEKAEDKEKNEKAFKEKQKQLEEHLKQEKTFEGWTYLVPSWTVDSVLKERKDLMVEKKDEKAKDSAATTDPGAAASLPPLSPEVK
jgi:Domain of unknown function (DUF4340)